MDKLTTAPPNKKENKSNLPKKPHQLGPIAESSKGTGKPWQCGEVKTKDMRAVLEAVRSVKLFLTPRWLEIYSVEAVKQRGLLALGTSGPSAGGRGGSGCSVHLTDGGPAPQLSSPTWIPEAGSLALTCQPAKWLEFSQGDLTGPRGRTKDATIWHAPVYKARCKNVGITCNLAGGGDKGK